MQLNKIFVQLIGIGALLCSGAALSNTIEVFVPGSGGTRYDDLSIVGIDDGSNPGRIENGTLKGLVALKYLGHLSGQKILNDEVRVVFLDGDFVLDWSESVLDFFFGDPVIVNASSPTLRISSFYIRRQQDTTLISFLRDAVSIGAYESFFQMGEVTGKDSGVGVDRVLLDVLGQKVPGIFLTQDSQAQKLLFSFNDHLRINAPNSSPAEGCFFQMGALESVAEYNISERHSLVFPGPVRDVARQ